MEHNDFLAVLTWYRNQLGNGNTRTSIRARYNAWRLRECSGYTCSAILRTSDASRWDSPFERACEVCDMCTDHCECTQCDNGGHTYDTNDGSCATCDSCTDHCDCVSCNECGERYRAGSRAARNLCSACDRCDSCGCNCETAEESNASERLPRFFKNDPKFHRATRAQHKVNPSTRFIAAEIEVNDMEEDRGISDMVANWRGCIVEDGSLPRDTGFEINTSPASGDVYVEQIAEICATLERSEAHVTSACGLHVHVDARDMNYYAIRRLIKLYAKLEPTLFQMVTKERRKSDYCMPCGDYYLTATGMADLTTHKALRDRTAKMIYGKGIKEARKNKYYGSAGSSNPESVGRYYALNLHSFFYRGTIECRLFGGTTNADKITKWGILWALIVDKALATTEKEMDALVSSGSALQILRSITTQAVFAFCETRLQSYGSQRTKDEMGGSISGADAQLAEIAESAERTERIVSALRKEENRQAAQAAESARWESERLERRAQETRERAERDIAQIASDELTARIAAIVITPEIRSASRGYGNSCGCDSCCRDWLTLNPTFAEIV